MALNGEKVARKIVEVASDKLAEDIVLLDVRELCSFADYFVICSGESQRQTSAIADEIDKALHKKGPKLLHKEGNVESGWLLMDYGDVIVHIFGAEERKFYQLDKLWAQAVPLIRIE
ncbi:MAG: ribosome silencing factor [Dehalococcoidia bacterium]|jgi:ribosome-associated protein